MNVLTLCVAFFVLSAIMLFVNISITGGNKL